jgi:FlaG/FlaF family flagellin (archaellin)
VSRAYAPVAVVLLLAVTVLAAGAMTLALPSLSGEPPPQRGVAVDATDDGRVTLTLLAGEAIDLQQATLRVTVDGDPLRHHPPVPYFAADGFYGTPTGPFNNAASDQWRVGESGTLRIASTNAPLPAPGDTVAVRVLVDGQTVATAETTVVRTERD